MKVIRERNGGRIVSSTGLKPGMIVAFDKDHQTMRIFQHNPDETMVTELTFERDNQVYCGNLITNEVQFGQFIHLLSKFIGLWPRETDIHTGYNPSYIFFRPH